MRKLFHRITFRDIVTKELAEARLARLASQNNAEYHASQVGFRNAQIERLEKELNHEQTTTFRA